MADSQIITSLCWVPRGHAKAVLKEFEPSEETLDKHQKLEAKLAQGKSTKHQDIKQAAQELQKNMDNMDIDSSDEENGGGVPIFTSELAALKEKEKAKIKKKDEDFEEESYNSDEDMEEAFETKGAIKDEYPDQLDDSEEEKEDFTIRKSDGIIVTATAESDHSNLEVYVYDYTTSDLYVHHEIILSSYPLCLEWLPVHGGQKVNYMIVGTFLPEIEIWDLDTEDCEPVGILGSVEQSEKYKKKSIKQFNKSKKVLNPEQTHTDAVLSISLNPFQKEYLASGSADKTIKIWDLDDFQAKATFADIHTDKVQSVRWNNVNENILLSAGYDSKVNVMNVRDQKESVSFMIPKSAKDIESAQWHPTSEHNFVITTESGMLYGFDTRQPGQRLFDLNAHTEQGKSCSSISFNTHIPNMMATCSTDQTVKIWDIATDNPNNKPKCVYTKEMNQGDLFSLQFYKDIPWVLAAGGSMGQLAIWDTEECSVIKQHFKDSVNKNAPIVENASITTDAPSAKSKQTESKDEDFEDVSDEDSEDEMQDDQIKTSKKNKKNKKKSKK